MEQHGLFRLTKAPLVVSNGGLWDDIIPLTFSLSPALSLFSCWIKWPVPHAYFTLVCQTYGSCSCSMVPWCTNTISFFYSHACVVWHCKLSNLQEQGPKGWPNGHRVKFSALTCKHDLWPLDTNAGHTFKLPPYSGYSRLKPTKWDFNHV